MKIKRISSLILLSLLVSLFQSLPTANAAGPATQLVITRQSVPGASGAAFTTQPQLQVQDASGNAVTGSAFSISVYGLRDGRGQGLVGGSPSAQTVGTSTATTDLNGTATFDASFGISGQINTPITITYYLRSSGTTSLSLFATENVTLTVPGAASQLV